MKFRLTLEISRSAPKPEEVYERVSEAYTHVERGDEWWTEQARIGFRPNRPDVSEVFEGVTQP